MEITLKTSFYCSIMGFRLITTRPPPQEVIESYWLSSSVDLYASLVSRSIVSPDADISYCCAVANRQVLIEMNCFDAARAASENVEC